MIVHVALSVLVVTATAGSVLPVPPVAAEPTVNTEPPSTEAVETIAALQVRLRSERIALEDMQALLAEEEELYATLAERQTERALLTAQLTEDETVQAETFDEMLQTRGIVQQGKPLATFEHDIRRSLVTFVELQEVLAMERQTVEELQGLLDEEAVAFDRLQTPLSTPLRAQHTSHRDRLAEFQSQLASEEQVAIEDHRYGQRRIASVSLNRIFWPSIDTLSRKRALGAMDRQLDDTAIRTALRNSRLDQQQQTVTLLRADHQSRMESVAEYRALLLSLERDVEPFEDGLSSEEVEGYQERTANRITAYEAGQRLVTTEADIVLRLRTNHQTHKSVSDVRRAVVIEQFQVVDQLLRETTPSQQEETLAGFAALVDEEETLVARLQSAVHYRQLVSSELVGDDPRTSTVDDPLVGVYVHERDLLAELLRANLAVQASQLDADAATLRARDRTVQRLRGADGVQDRYRKIPIETDRLWMAAVNIVVEADRVDDEGVLLESFTAAQVEMEAVLTGATELVAEADRAVMRAARAQAQAVQTTEGDPIVTTTPETPQIPLRLRELAIPVIVVAVVVGVLVLLVRRES